MMKYIFTALAPNWQIDDVLLSLKLIFNPWRWKNGAALKELEKKFSEWLPTRYAIGVSSGRIGLYAILANLGLKPGDEVLLQAYTCVVVPEAIIWAGARPVYVDVVNDFNIDTENLKKKITPQSRVLIIQHTFGKPAELDKALQIAREHNLFVIEDSAHALGVFDNDKHLGAFGDASFFSFGRDKIISSVFGGMVTTNNQELAQKLRVYQTALPYPSNIWIFQQLLHPIITFFARATFGIFVGRIILFLARQLNFISKAVYPSEYKADYPPLFGVTFCNALAELALHQFGKLERFNEHRRMIANIYKNELGQMITHQPEVPNSSWLRYTICLKNSESLIKFMKSKKIFLGDWYNRPIAPPGVNYESVNYKLGDCPNAEKLAAESVNLPTDIHISPKDARRIANGVTKYTSNPHE